MESGLEGRNNPSRQRPVAGEALRLNGVRPRRPEQSNKLHQLADGRDNVSMESGLEGRNNFPNMGSFDSVGAASQWSPA